MQRIRQKRCRPQPSALVAALLEAAEEAAVHGHLHGRARHPVEALLAEGDVPAILDDPVALPAGAVGARAHDGDGVPLVAGAAAVADDAAAVVLPL